MKRQRRRLFVIAIAALLFGAIRGSNAVGQTPSRVEVRTLSLGIVSEVHQKEIEEHYRDFVGYLARKLSAASDVEAKVIIASTPTELAKLLGQQKVDFYMESTYSTYVINDVQGAGKLLLRRWQRGKPEYQSLIFTKRNSGVNRLDDLRGKIIVFEDPESTSGYFLPKFFLLRNGFKLSEKGRLDASVAPGEIGYVFASSQEKLVDLVLTEQAAGGAFSDDDYAKLDEKAKADVGVLAQSERLPRHLVSIRKDMAPPLADRLKAILLSMSEDDEGRKILQKTGETTKFDMLPEGEEGMRRRLLETFYSPAKK
ncbi:MAG TPA: phosphate/phosphite/phosphonate ABC transporter substrate-binding protein [Candidatus Binatia bacterium]|jgi:phosphate/phosphite/phosphonate ABC transporter binding protein|nr:phosphate/phosphite/phosphonate ABC transporter substrate-binding protein [Candidatus Binatia bacterium]